MKFRAVVEIMPLRRPWSTLKTCLKHLWKIVTTQTMLMSEAISYVRSTIELNIRNIMLFVGKNSVQSVEPSDAKNIKYFEIQAGDKWRVPLARKIIEVRANTLEVPGFDEEELETISDYFVQSSFGSIVLFFPFLSFRSFLWASSVLVLLLLIHNN